MIIDYVKEYITEDDYAISPNDDWVNFNSVFTADSKRHMGICFSRNIVKDFKIDRTWSILRFVAEHQRLESDIEARAFLMKIAFRLRRLRLVRQLQRR